MECHQLVQVMETFLFCLSTVDEFLVFLMREL